MKREAWTTRLAEAARKALTAATPAGGKGEDPEIVQLPPPTLNGNVSLERALHARRSIREYTRAPLTLPEAGQLLWAAQGITSAWGGRTAPSAGVRYPLETYLAAGHVEGLPAGIYRYRPDGHLLVMTAAGDPRISLSAAALNQSFIRSAPAAVILTAVFSRTTEKYGQRGLRYVHMDAGYAAQNIHLQAEALCLGTVTVGAFDDGAVKRALALTGEEEPLAIIPVGRK